MSDKKHNLDKELHLMHQQVQKLEQELLTQKQISYAAGIFQGDVTVRTLLESLAEGVIVCDPNGRVVLINRRAEELFGYQSDDVAGQSLSIFLPQRYLYSHGKLVKNFFESPHVRSMGQGIDLTGKRQNGTEFPVEVSLSYLQTDVGPLGLAFVTDITERKQAEWELRLRNEELDAFAHTVAHDLKASLATLIGYSEILAETHRTLSETERDEYFFALARNGRLMSNIIDELLVFASMRKEDVPYAPLEMDTLVHNALNRLNYMIKESNAQIKIVQHFLTPLGYAPWVEEIWFNYITNAIKYGGEPPVVEIGCEAAGDLIKFWVRDNGEGISEQKQQEAFEPFKQMSHLKVEGYGLGLSIVKKIVEKLNGRVSVDSAEGQGSTFSFYLKAAPDL